MKLKFLLTLAVLNLANSARAEDLTAVATEVVATTAPAVVAEVVATTAPVIAAETTAAATAAATVVKSSKLQAFKDAALNKINSTAKAAKELAVKAKDAVASKMPATPEWVNKAKTSVTTKYNDVKTSKCVESQIKFVQAHKKAIIIGTAVVAAAGIAYAVYKNNKNKQN